MNIDRKPSVLLEERFRRKLIEQAIERVGSKYGLAMELGYSSAGSGKTINDWLKGRLRIPYHKLEKLCEIVDVSIDEILKHSVRKY